MYKIDEAEDDMKLSIDQSGNLVYRIPNTSGSGAAQEEVSTVLFAKEIRLGNYTIQQVTQPDGVVHLEVRAAQAEGGWLTRSVIGTPPNS